MKFGVIAMVRVRINLAMAHLAGLILIQCAGRFIRG
jgi:hypothetical protein